MTLIRRLQSAAPYGVALAAGVFLYHTADRFDYERTPGRIGPYAWPKLVLTLAIATAAVGLAKALVRPPPPRSEEADQAEMLVRPPEVHPHLVWIGVAATIAFLVALPIFGFFLSSIPYVGAIIYAGHYRRLAWVVPISVIVPIIFMILFMRIVYVALPLGIAPFDSVSLAILSIIGLR